MGRDRGLGRMSAIQRPAGSPAPPARMAGPACLRWAPGRVHTWRRPEDGGFAAGRYGVSAIGDDTTPREFCSLYHYSGSYPAARLRYGLYDLEQAVDPVLVGVAVLSVPASERVLTSVFPCLEPYTESLEVGRLALSWQVPSNAESYFLGQVYRLAAGAGIRGLVMFADPVPRTTADGRVVFPGHAGCIYQSTNCAYLGRAARRVQLLLPDGSVFSPRAASKIRRGERGCDYAVRQLIAQGARVPRAGENLAAWLAEVLQDIGRRLDHPGPHRYGFVLGPTRRERAAVTIALPRSAYPKQDLGQATLDLDFTAGGAQ
jgi:hypothetical protein